MRVKDLEQVLANIPEDAKIGIRVEGNPQGHSLVVDEGYNHQENIYWMNAVISGEEDE